MLGIDSGVHFLKSAKFFPHKLIPAFYDILLVYWNLKKRL